VNEPLPGIGVQNGESKQQVIETGLRRLWEKLRAAAQLIAALRQDKAEFSARIAALEAELDGTRIDMAGMDSELKRLRTERAQLMQVGDSDRFTPEEKDILKSRIRELLAKINSHL